MPTPTITVTLSESGSGDTITLRSPAPDIPVLVHRHGSTIETPGNGIAQYKVGAARFEANLNIPDMRNTVKDALELFFRTHWGKSTVTYTDENANAFTVRFLDNELPLTKVQKNLWTVNLRLYLSAILK